MCNLLVILTNLSCGSINDLLQTERLRVKSMNQCGEIRVFAGCNTKCRNGCSLME